MIFKLQSVRTLFQPSVVLLMDGGICSQMNQYLMGAYLMRRGERVEFNLRFFRKDGKDVEGKHVRNFDLLKLFPNLPFQAVSPLKLYLYKHWFPYYGFTEAERSKPWWEVRAPKFVSGYFYFPQEVYQLFPEVFHPQPEQVLDADNLAVYRQIAPENTVAVHVRRGDLTVARMGYGKPVTLDYYRQAIGYFVEHLSHAKFYFFSDDPAYVREELIPSLPFPLVYDIIENGDAKGYMDLLLISRCQHQITSKGSLGKFGAALSKSENKIVIHAADDENIDILQAVKGQILKL